MKFGILSDAHGHVEAFDAALALLRHKGAEHFFFLGDAVGYLPRTEVVTRLMTYREILCIRGNHEEMLLCGGISTEKDELYKLNTVRRMLSGEEFAFLESWPPSRVVEIDNMRLLLVHGSPLDPLFGYIYPDTDLAAFNSVNATHVFMGNTHRPFVRSSNDITFVNVGSCGLPRDRGDLGSVCLFDNTSGEVQIWRFDISAHAKLALANAGGVAPAVSKLFQRRESWFFGEIS